MKKIGDSPEGKTTVSAAMDGPPQRFGRNLAALPDSSLGLPPSRKSGLGAEPVGALGRSARRLSAAFATFLLIALTTALAPQAAQAAQTITLTLIPGDGQIELVWAYTGSTSGASKWQVEYFPGSSGDQWRDLPGGAAARRATIPVAGGPKVANGTEYNVRIRLLNTSNSKIKATTDSGEQSWVKATPMASKTTYQQLDGTGDLAPMAVEYARELVMVPGGKKTVALKSPAAADGGNTMHRVAARLKRQILKGDTAYLRLALGGGMVFAEGKTVNNIGWHFSADPAKAKSACVNNAGTKKWDDPDNRTSVGQALKTAFITGRPGADVAVFKIDTDASDYGVDGDDHGAAGTRLLPVDMDIYDTDDPVDAECDAPKKPVRIFAEIADFLAVPAGAGSYTASLSLHGNPDEALAGTNASTALAGTATIVKVVDGLDATVKAEAQPAVAHVGTSPQPFLWFRDASAATGVKNKAVLGSAKATVARDNLYNAANGKLATGSDLLPDGSVNFSVEGDFSIGAFNLKVSTDATDSSKACPEAGTAGSPAMGNLKPAEDGPADMAMLNGQNAGTYHLCVQVDTMGANATPIPAGIYRGTISRNGASGGTTELATGVIGNIRRNGTTVDLTYLTVSEKYDQRLVIVNKGSVDATYTLGSFVTEAGTQAMPKAAASGMVAAGSQAVLPVVDLVEFTGPMTRAAATLSINADVDDIRVVTTQVNLQDGSTDTVVYASVDGATVN